jgi:hypothetical protein
MYGSFFDLTNSYEFRKLDLLSSCRFPLPALLLADLDLQYSQIHLILYCIHCRDPLIQPSYWISRTRCIATKLQAGNSYVLFKVL